MSLPYSCSNSSVFCHDDLGIHPTDPPALYSCSAVALTYPGCHPWHPSDLVWSNLGCARRHTFLTHSSTDIRSVNKFPVVCKRYRCSAVALTYPGCHPWHPSDLVWSNLGCARRHTFLTHSSTDIRSVNKFPVVCKRYRARTLWNLWSISRLEHRPIRTTTQHNLHFLASHTPLYIGWMMIPYSYALYQATLQGLSFSNTASFPCVCTCKPLIWPFPTWPPKRSQLPTVSLHYFCEFHLNLGTPLAIFQT